MGGEDVRHDDDLLRRIGGQFLTAALRIRGDPRQDFRHHRRVIRPLQAEGPRVELGLDIGNPIDQQLLLCSARGGAAEDHWGPRVLQRSAEVDARAGHQSPPEAQPLCRIVIARRHHHLHTAPSHIREEAFQCCHGPFRRQGTIVDIACHQQQIHGVLIDCMRDPRQHFLLLAAQRKTVKPPAEMPVRRM